jgi:hypothetical protein
VRHTRILASSTDHDQRIPLKIFHAELILTLQYVALTDGVVLRGLIGGSPFTCPPRRPRNCPFLRSANLARPQTITPSHSHTGSNGRVPCGVITGAPARARLVVPANALFSNPLI